MEKLRTELASLKEKESLMKKIVENGGWGLMEKIRGRVTQLQKQ